MTMAMTPDRWDNAPVDAGVGEAPPAGRRGGSIPEVLAVFAVYNLVSLAWDRAGSAAVERELLGWSYVGGLLFFVVPAAAILVAGRGFGGYGLVFWGRREPAGRAAWALTIGVGLTCYLAQVLQWRLGSMVIEGLHVPHASLPGAMVLSGLWVAAILLVLSVWRGAAGERPFVLWVGWRVAALLFLYPFVVVWSVRRLTAEFASGIVWQLLFGGLGEEFLYRGYIQSRLNQEFGRPFRLLGTSFGPGLVIASLLYAVPHLMNAFNPLAAQYGLNAWWGVWTFFAGMFYGLVRERTGSIVAGAIARGLPAAAVETLVGMFTL